MKKKVIAILSMVLIVTSIATITVFATKALRGESLYEQRLKNNGYTEEDRWKLEAIKYLSDENVSARIVLKKKELKDWEKVREYYNVDEEAYEKYITGKRFWQKQVDAIPEYIFAEMKELNWTDSEVRDFINKTSILKIDYKYAWEEIKNGKKLDEILEAKREENKAISTLTNEFVYGEMTIADYENKLSQISKKNSSEKKKVVKDAEIRRKEIRDRHKKESGITDAEIKYCESQGMTNPMDMYQAKSISKKNKVSLEKVVGAKMKNGNWTKTTAEVLGIPYTERKAQIDNIKKASKEQK